MTTKTILGLGFFSGTPAEAAEAGLRGGLVVVPSAPVLVDMADRSSLREALLGADLAITDSGLMVLMWRLLTGEKLERVSGLEYLKLLLERLRPETGDLRPESSEKNSGLGSHGTGLSEAPQVSGLSPQVSHAGDGVFWIMPTAAARDRNLAWLQSAGHRTTVEDCYVAPVYPADGSLSDDELLSVIRKRRPAHIIIALGGGVQERVGYALRQALAVPRLSDGGYQLVGSNPNNQQPITNNRPAYRPGIHCIGAAIGFLSGEQVRIPTWVDYLYLGWLWRSMSAPTRFVPRYWKAKRLIGLMIRYRGKSPGG